MRICVTYNQLHAIHHRAASTLMDSEHDCCAACTECAGRAWFQRFSPRGQVEKSEKKLRQTIYNMTIILIWFFSSLFLFFPTPSRTYRRIRRLVDFRSLTHSSCFAIDPPIILPITVWYCNYCVITITRVMVRRPNWLATKTKLQQC